MRERLALATLVFAAALAGAAHAETTTQMVLVDASQPAPLMVETGVRDDCSQGQVPESRVVVEPKHGSLTVREGRLQRQGAGCPPAIGYVVVYIPEPDYTGHDEVALEVMDADGVTLRVFDITVGPSGLPEGVIAG
jgi:hypothetical protein